MAYDPKQLLSPPSVLFPLGAALAGYYLADKNAWGAVAGALAGALFNASAVIVDQKQQNAAKSGATSFEANYGAEAVSALIGVDSSKVFGSGGKAAPANGASVTAGNMYLYRNAQRR
jgi:hypothetical protein